MRHGLSLGCVAIHWPFYCIFRNAECCLVRLIPFPCPLSKVSAIEDDSDLEALMSGPIRFLQPQSMKVLMSLRGSFWLCLCAGDRHRG